MKFVTVAYIVISLCFSGAAQSRIRVEPIVPHLSHREYIILDNTNHPLSARSLVPISGVEVPNQFSATEDTTTAQSIVEIPGVEVAKQFVAKQFGYLDGKDFVVKNTYTSDNGVTHTYLKQLYLGKEIVNGDLNINVDKNGKVISYGNSFYKSNDAPQGSLLPDNFGNAVDAFDALFKHIKIDSGVEKSNIVVKGGRSADEPTLLTNITSIPKDVKAKKKYIQTATSQLEPVWDLEVGLNENWINAFVTSSNKVIGLHDWVHEARYNVIPIDTRDPEAGERKVIIDPGSSTSSPLGWHDQGKDRKFTTTTGNNVIAFDNSKSTSDWTKAPRAEGGANLNFDFPIDFKQDASTYVDASITNIFYVTNMLHDIYYAHGFDERAGNFQQNNFGKGGEEGDPVLVRVQDTAGINNGYFTPFPDGQPSYLTMFIIKNTSPYRDVALDNGFIIHEYTHGLSYRLTGGSANTNCLSLRQSKGMSEGWGDVMAYVLRTHADYNRNFDFGFGNYVNKGKTYRQYLYSTNKKTNPETYESINSYNQEHSIGAVWAEILYEVYWNLIEQAGFSPDLLSGKHDHGNTLFIRLLIDGMKLQPCNPSFIQARDAIIQAEDTLAEKNHIKDTKLKCAIWKGFATRGLGDDASFNNGKAVNGYKLPQGC